MKHVKLPIFILLLSSFAYNSAFAWGMTGHRIVGEIAQRNLNRKAQKAIKAILGSEDLAMCANWADFIKSDPTYNYLASWHYINFQQGLSKEAFDLAIQADTLPNAHNKLLFLADELQHNNSLDLETKRMYLRLLVHIVGDIHQPMHTGRREDLGGNEVKVFWFGQSSNLHQVWDEKLIDYQQLSYTEYATYLNHCSKQEIKNLQAAPVEQWLYESYQISETLYQTVQPEEKLSYRYNFEHVDELNQSLLNGGIRLAGLLNKLFS
ncbi:S1/P1 nuclease [Olivibacter sitiensis]|uniref:S1/P1 nuclease n=1 Tax=Olivibacter sitiensis TaxID=376470 RepID=UPI0003FC8142|nr:S1/P1 nuclease [Olivibacter sitiensis]